VVLPASVSLSVRVLARVVTAGGLGELHPVLAPTPVWRADGDDEPLSPALGWVDRRGVLDREVAAALAVLCRPRAACHGWITCGRVTTAVLAAAIGKEAVLAVRCGGTVRLSRISASRLVERLVAQTPVVPAARGVPVVVSLSELHAAGPTKAGNPAVLRVRRLVALPTSGAGELYAGDSAPVCYVDTAVGRVVVTPLGDGVVRVGGADLVGQLRDGSMAYR
jgi:ESX secretion-associated protein EspG